MLATPFLTDLDSRAAVKGSRDPLGIQPIWTRLGRQVIGNLTTVSDSVRDFTTTLLGYFFAERVAADRGPGTELATFLKWEQLAAFARAHGNDDWGFRGTERVRAALDIGSRIVLSADQQYQILSNQKIYGLWGLYTVPARASGLLDGDPPRLTPRTNAFVESNYLPVLRDAGFGDGRAIIEILRKDRSPVDVEHTESKLITAIARILDRRMRGAERDFYREHLLYGGPDDRTGGRQRQLAALLEPTLDQANFAWSPGLVGALAKEALAQEDPWVDLATRLSHIRTCETVTAPVWGLFLHLLGLNDQPVEKLVARLREQWGPGVGTVAPENFSALAPTLETIGEGVGARWIAIAETASRGDYAALVNLLLEQNRWVMGTRGAAPWVEIDGGKLRVRFRDEDGALPTGAELPTLWRSPYFLESLRSVARTLREA